MMRTRTDFDGIEIEPAARAEFAIIWLHGLGADGNDFVPLVPQLRLPCPTRFVFPHAPVRPVTINGGYPMRAWYDVLSFDRDGAEDAIGINASADLVRELIGREESRGVPRARIVLAGFSQGGAIALYTALTDGRRLAGVVALSTYLPLADTVLGGSRAITPTTPVWMAHGDQDPVIELALADWSRRRLQAAGIELVWHTYPMPHCVCADEVRDMGDWLTQLQRDGSS